jgi:hypothetical protein
MLEGEAYDKPNKQEVARFARDAVALAAVVVGTYHNGVQRRAFVPCISDFFEALPIIVGQDYWHLLTANVNDLMRPELFRMTTPAHLANPDTWNFDFDTALIRVLDKFLSKYAAGGHGRQVRLIWRSIDLTFNAALSFAGFSGSLADFAHRVPIWVAAFETLCHPLNATSGFRM